MLRKFTSLNSLVTINVLLAFTSHIFASIESSKGESVKLDACQTRYAKIIDDAFEGFSERQRPPNLLTPFIAQYLEEPIWINVLYNELIYKLDLGCDENILKNNVEMEGDLVWVDHEALRNFISRETGVGMNYIWLGTDYKFTRFTTPRIPFFPQADTSIQTPPYIMLELPAPEEAIQKNLKLSKYPVNKIFFSYFNRKRTFSRSYITTYTDTSPSTILKLFNQTVPSSVGKKLAFNCSNCGQEIPDHQPITKLMCQDVDSFGISCMKINRPINVTTKDLRS